MDEMSVVPATNPTMDKGAIPMPSRVAQDCNHFAIRQYVLNMREKDRNKCLLFASEGEIEKLLPPMVVPKYKYWFCENCLNRNGQENVDKGESQDEEPGNQQVGSCGSNKATKVNKTTSVVNGELVKHHSLKLDSSEDSECPIKERLLESVLKETANSETILCGTEGSPSNSIPSSKGKQKGCRVPQRKREASKGKEKNRPSNHQSGKERNSLSKGKAAHIGNRKVTTVPWREIINKIDHTEKSNGKSQSSVEGAGSSKSKHDSSTIRGFMSPQQQKKSDWIKKRSIRVHAQESKTSIGLHMNQIFEEGLMKRKGVETTTKGSDIHVIRPLDLTLNNPMSSNKHGKDHAKAGRGVLSCLPAGESSIFHKNYKRKYNLYAGESSVSHKSTSGPYVEEMQKNVIDKKSLSNVEVSHLPSNKNLPLVQNMDFPQLREEDNQANTNVLSFPKVTEKVIIPWLQTDFPTTPSNLAPTNGNNHDCSPLISDQMLFIEKIHQKGAKESSNTGTNGPFIDQNEGKKVVNLVQNVADQNDVFLFGKRLSACNTHPSISRIGKTDLVEKELFPKSSLKFWLSESSSSFNSTHVKRAPAFPVNFFGRVQDEVSLGGVDSPAVSLMRQTIIDPVGPLTLGSSFMQGRVGSMNDQTRTDVCTINVNPADFIYPNARIESKVGRRPRSRGKSVIENGHGRIKPRVKKAPSAKERAKDRQT